MVLSLDRWVGKTAVVTGASVGMGAKIAEQLVKAGINVVGLARRKENIEQLAKNLSKEKGKLYAVKADMSKEEDILAAFKWIKANVGPVHILINNAGVVQETQLIGGDAKKWKFVFDVNVLGVCIATREAIASMKENKIDGHIVHISSTLGHKIIDVPNLNVYPSSKHALRALTETLRLELNRIGSKIKISSVSPGMTKSEFGQTNNMTLTPQMIEMMKKATMLECEDVADSVLYTLSTPPHVQVHELIVQPVNTAS